MTMRQQELELKSNTELTREIRQLLLTMDAERLGTAENRT